MADAVKRMDIAEPDAMRGTVVHRPVVETHICGPGWVWTEDGPMGAHYYWRDPWDVAVGTVVECDCGQTWVCVRDPGGEGRRVVVMAHNVWRRETRRERKRRERDSHWQPVKGMVRGYGKTPTIPPPPSQTGRATGGENAQ